jgi:hypothetical protein
MKKCLAVIIALTLMAVPMGTLFTSAAGKVVFTDQDFTALRSGFLKDRGGIESVGAFEEDHFRYWGGDGLLANGDGYYVGYITYKVSAPTNEKIESLKLDLVGRIGTYDDGGFTAAEWAARYWMHIYVFQENYAFDRTKWTEYDDKLAITPELTINPPSVSEEYSFDLSQWAEGGKDVYITIATYGEWTPNWIGFSHLTLSGTTAAAASTPAPTVTKAPVSSTDNSSQEASSLSVASTGESLALSSSGTESATLTESDSSSIASSAAGNNDSTVSEDTSSAVSAINTEPGSNTWWIVPTAAVVALAVVIAGIFFVRRRRKSPKV